MKVDRNPDPSFGLDKAFDAIRRMPVPDQPPVTELLALLTIDQPIDPPKANTRGVRKLRSSNRRYLMRILVPSAAAALLLVGGLGLLFLNNTPALALGDVVEAAKKHKLVKYKHKQTDFTNDGKVASLDAIRFADLKALRIRSESRHKFQDPDDREKLIEEVSVSVQDVPNNRWLMTNTHPGGKVRVPRKDGALLRIGEEGKKTKSFLENLEEFQKKKGVTSGKDTLGGREMVRFRLEEENNTTSLWVDAKTKLPFRNEFELVTPTATLKFVDTDYEWDPPLPKGFANLDALFSTRPPEGYSIEDRTKEKGRPEGEPAKAP
jgi:hypothetical protein